MANQLDSDKRVRYFDGQVLKADDLKQEQFYHVHRRYLHNRLLHSPGIIVGLDATGAPGSDAVAVSVGSAVNANGEEIVLGSAMSIPLTNLAGVTDAEIYVVFATTETDASAGNAAATRIAERPIFVVRKTAPTADGVPDGGVLLAKIRLGADGKLVAVPDASVRTRAGTVIGDDLTIRSLTWGNHSRLQADQGGSIELGGDNTTAGTGIPYIDFHFSGQTQDFNARIINDANGRLSLVAPVLQVSGNIGIGEGAPSGRLHVAGNADQPGTARFVPHPNKGPNHSHIHWDATGDWYIRSAAAAGKVVIQDSGGRVGVGTSSPVSKLQVKTLTAVGEGPSAAGAWANFGSNAYFDGAWKRIDAAKAGANLHVNADGAGQEFRFFRMEADGSRQRNLAVIGSTLSFINEGNVGIGTTAPQFRLDVADRMRVRQGGAGTAGIWFFQTGPNADRAFVGMMNDNAVGFWGNTGAQWGLIMDTATGNVSIRGSITAGGGKGGYVMDQFVNRLGQVLEQGDVVVIGENQATLYYGSDKNIPIPEVDISARAYDTRVCGIVSEMYTQMGPEAAKEPGAEAQAGTEEGRDGNTDIDTAADRPRVPTGDNLAHDRTRVEPGQKGWMVTLGAFAHCKVDADIAPIQVGDLLTTSPTKGHAQKVQDPAKRAGAILGKALGPLESGRGKIPVLVMLQ